MTPRELEIIASVGEWTRINRKDTVELGDALYFMEYSGGDIDTVTFGKVNGEPSIIGFAEFRTGPEGRFESQPICYKRR